MSLNEYMFQQASARVRILVSAGSLCQLRNEALN